MIIYLKSVSLPVLTDNSSPRLGYSFKLEHDFTIEAIILSDAFGLKRLSEIFEVSLDELLKDEDEKKMMIQYEYLIEDENQ